MPSAQLLPDSVHLWFARPAEISAQVARRCLEVLSADERARQQRFIFDRHRLEFGVSHALVRETLSRYAPVAPEQWEFSCNPQGCPRIVPRPDAPGLRFNLSHTSGLVACAVTLDRAIGVDVEETRADRATASIARSVFSPHEVAALEALEPELQGPRFFSYWTLKEAYIKARELGLSLPLDKFSFTLHPEQAPTIAFHGLDDRPERWWFHCPQLSGPHACAVAVERSVGETPTLTVEETVPFAR